MRFYLFVGMTDLAVSIRKFSIRLHRPRIYQLSNSLRICNAG